MSDNHALGTEKHLEDVETALQIMTLFQEGTQKKNDAKKQCKQAEDESPSLLFAQMTKADTMKKGLCFKCGKCVHRANECKTKEETIAAEGMQAVQVEDQEQVEWMKGGRSVLEIMMTGGRGPTIVTEEKSKMTAGLIKLLVCSRNRHHTGSLACAEPLVANNLIVHRE